MSINEAKEIIRKAIYRVIPTNVKIEDDDNLLSYMGAFEMVYVITFIEEEIRKDLCINFGEQPDNLTISGLAQLLL